jgi:three-Cys-motif partner protein
MRTMADVIPGSDGLIARDSGSWAKDKLYYLERYLYIFSVGMGEKWPEKLYYVDLFAGPGHCLTRDTREEIDGSPLRALKFNFAKYFFFEVDPACCEALAKRVEAQAPEKLGRVAIISGDCNEHIDKVQPPTSGLGLAFVDPTGISQISFETVRKLAVRRRIDLLINFPEGMGIRMNLHHYTRSEENALNTFMGSDRWKQRFQRVPTSFDQACSEIANEYLENLRSLGYLALDKDWIPVRTNQNALLYYLLFASKHPRGTDLWHKIGRIEPHGQRKLF